MQRTEQTIPPLPKKRIILNFEFLVAMRSYDLLCPMDSTDQVNVFKAQTFQIFIFPQFPEIVTGFNGTFGMEKLTIIGIRFRTRLILQRGREVKF